MTVSSSTNRDDYSGNGSTVNFAVNFRFLANSHVKVILTSATGVETTQIETTNYTLTGAGADSGGTLTMLVAPATGETLTILRNVPFTQETDYVENDAFPAESHEQALDKLTMLVQQQQEELDRSLKLTESQQSSGLTIPSPVNNNLLRWDINGDLENVTEQQLGTVAEEDLIKEFATVSLMKADTSLISGRIVDTSGYTTSGDGGGARYLIQTAAEFGGTPDELGDHTLANGNIAVLQVGLSIHASAYGFLPASSGAINTAALGAAIDKAEASAPGAVVSIQSGSFTLASASSFAINADGVYISGAGREATILNSSGNGDLFTFSNTGRGSGIEKLSIKYAVKPTTGSVIKAETSATSNVIDRITIIGCYDGITLGNSQATKLTHVEIWDFDNTGLNFTGNLNDPYIGQIFLNGSNNASAVGWKIAGKAHAMLASDVEIIQCNQPAQWIGTVSSIETVAFSRLFNCFFDSSASPAYYEYLRDVEFHGCWWSQRETGATFQNSKLVKFFGGGPVNCDNHGFILQAGSEDFEFHGVNFDSNSQSASNTYSGLVVASGVGDFKVIGGYAGNAGLFSATQSNGIALLGSNDNYIINGVTFEGNVNSTISGHTASVTKRVRDCQGYITSNAGSFGTNTDANGEDVIPHGLSVTPLFGTVFVTGDTNVEATIIGFDATNITIRIRDSTTNADVTSAAVNVRWSASSEVA